MNSWTSLHYDKLIFLFFLLDNCFPFFLSVCFLLQKLVYPSGSILHGMALELSGIFSSSPQLPSPEHCSPSWTWVFFSWEPFALWHGSKLGPLVFTLTNSSTTWLHSPQPIPLAPQNGCMPLRDLHPPRPRAPSIKGHLGENPARPRGAPAKGPKPPRPRIIGENSSGNGHLGGKPWNPRGPNPKPRFGRGNGPLIMKFRRSWGDSGRGQNCRPGGANVQRKWCDELSWNPLPRWRKPPLEQKERPKGSDEGSSSS